ncbi:MAG: SH3 domain-containing protein [Oscillospiraceae bacterium]|nr:SH3 domain-containing protein [Oscillospiraceae bacterium]
MKTAKKLFAVLLVAALCVPMFTLTALASNDIAYGAATVDTNDLNLRSGPGLSNSVITTLNEGDIVVILERTNSEWYHINFHGVLGYVNTSYLRDILTAENFSAVGEITGDLVNIRSKPAVDSTLLGTYSKDTIMTVIGINTGWYKVIHDGHTGYVRSDYMTIISGTRASSSSTGSSSGTGSGSTAAVSHSYTAPPANLTLGEQIVDYALSFLGSKYVWGGASPSGFDCSGFVTYVLKYFDISVSRTAQDQYNNDGLPVNKSDLSPGDLVFFSSNGSYISHVGIYIGNDEFVHASSSSTGVIVSRLDSAYYTRVWYGGKRIA